MVNWAEYAGDRSALWGDLDHFLLGAWIFSSSAVERPTDAWNMSLGEIAHPQENHTHVNATLHTSARARKFLCEG